MTSLDNEEITTLFKLSPWEWLVQDPFGTNLLKTVQEGRIRVIEPVWKMLLSNKGLLAVLWEMYPHHPYLTEAHFDRRQFTPGTKVVAKPLLGREGANIQIVAPGYETATGGVYGDEGFVYQMFDPLPEFDGFRPCTSAWLAGDTAAGLGIRETAGLITDDGAAFVPHRIPES